MNSLILRTATRYILPLLLMFSFLLLLTGHNTPGGGFVGGLVAALAFCLYAMAFDAPSARRLLRLDPGTFIAAGLAVALASTLIGPITEPDAPLLASVWRPVDLPLIGHTKVGTPMLFDFGVYLTVLGVTTMMIFAMREE